VIPASLAAEWDPAPLVLAGAAVALILFARAFRRLRARGRADHAGWDRAALFAAAVAVFTLALVSPLDAVAEGSLLSAHMLQHVLLMDVAPALALVALRGPLLLFLVPRPVLVAGARVAPLRRALRFLLRPRSAFVAWAAALAAWHVPAAYDLALRRPWVHDLEHLSFLVFGTVFWIPVLDSPPLHRRLDDLRAAFYVSAGAATGWVLGVVLALATSPLYPAYAELARRLGGISAVADQQLAAGVMIGLGAIPPSIAVFVLLYRWLDDGRAPARRLRGEPLGFLHGR
jgi:cytochrome c oxidase assembly factor CtaG